MNLAEQTMGDEAAWHQECERIAREQVYVEEREALRRVANGLGNFTDAALLAGSLGHRDLFTERVSDEI